MNKFIPTAVTAMIAGVVLAGCGSGQAASPRPASKTPTPHPSPSATARPNPTGPFAVVVTNSNRQGVSYQVELVDLTGHIVASATAKLPLLKPNQTVAPPLVSTSDHRVYYLDGDSDIRALDPSGQTALVRSIDGGSDHILAFAVSQGDTRIAVALIAQASDATKSTSTGYVEDLATPANHVSLWNNTGRDALRWPVGWHGTAIVDDIDDCGGYYGYGSGVVTACSYHVVDPATGKRLATICEGPATQPSDSYVSYSPSGLPTRTGVACNESEQSQTSCAATHTISAADWRGGEHDFASKSNSPTCGTDSSGLTVNNCYLSPDGTVMACTDTTTNAATLLLANGTNQNLGRRYNILGWMDANHVFCEVDAKTWGILRSDTQELTTIPFDHADQAAMVAAFPGVFG